MKKLVIACMFFANSAWALQVSDPEIFCETRASVSTFSSFKHCEKMIL
jgi:hypothetical protein